ncbi:hypothetical protein [Waddlia chondrophila]|uniref:Uncharacterized protein n=2 Tax=Waddlia chondrophila TaxID=71667 RepID=D6YS24_WADCW|nr:hypothetical protein [Waddlia chondrophila]ADI38869.1 conserved hypothetical protein [Waddlia chondrophila WSU 86-1044]
MHNMQYLENYYRRSIKNISENLPEDIIQVDLKLLHQLDLMNYYDSNDSDPSLTRYFHVIETDEKITLVNEDFIVWIVPEKINGNMMTYTLIALNTPNEPQLQMCFVTSGVYNTSRLVLRLLEKYLSEIQENETLINGLNSEFNR